jgi:hypothetical protein
VVPGLRGGPFFVHIGLGLAALLLLVAGHYAAPAGESYTLFFIPPALVVWLLLALVVVLLAKESGPIQRFAWLVPFAFPPLALGVGLGFFQLLG